MTREEAEEKERDRGRDESVIGVACSWADEGKQATYCLDCLVRICLDPLALCKGDPKRTEVRVSVDVIVVPEERRNRVSGFPGIVVGDSTRVKL